MQTGAVQANDGQLGYNRSRSRRVKWFWRYAWLIPVLATGAATLEVHSTALDNLVTAAFVVIPQVLLLLLLKLFRIRWYMHLGAAIALALQPLLAFFAVVASPGRGGQWWWVYVLTMPGAILGSIIVTANDKRTPEMPPTLGALKSAWYMLIPIIANVAICVALR